MASAVFLQVCPFSLRVVSVVGITYLLPQEERPLCHPTVERWAAGTGTGAGDAAAGRGAVLARLRAASWAWELGVTESPPEAVRIAQSCVVLSGTYFFLLSKLDLGGSGGR